MMKNKKLISAILAAASIAGGVVGAQAADLETVAGLVDKHEVKIFDLQTTVDALDTSIATQGSQISQIQQDMAQDAMDHAAEMDKLTTKVNQKADKADVEENKNDIASNAAAIQTETQKREEAVKGLQDKLTVANGQIENEKTTRENAVNDLQNQVTANKNAIATQGSQISQIQQDMAQDAMDHAAEMDKLTTKVNQKADKADVEENKNDIASNAAAIQTETQKREEAVKGLQDKLTVANGQIENEKTTRENADKAEAKAREEADTKLQNNIDNEAAARIAGDNALNSRINQVESDATKGIAKASALAALHPLDYDPDNKFDIAAAGGFYKGENAFALGAFYRPNRNVMLSMGTTLTSGDNAYNVGLTFKIGKSGKHTEAGLTTADLYAMIGAMQDKMDQQQKKIEELEAKHAK
uniref:YadA-like family protein n=1 Tax=Dialister sp. TaxID=1955814 RepID=UPI00402814F8